MRSELKSRHPSVQTHQFLPPSSAIDAAGACNIFAVRQEREGEYDHQSNFHHTPELFASVLLRSRNQSLCSTGEGATSVAAIHSLCAGHRSSGTDSNRC